MFASYTLERRQGKVEFVSTNEGIFVVTVLEELEFLLKILILFIL